jgi:hypothetical protein
MTTMTILATKYYCSLLLSYLFFQMSIVRCITATRRISGFHHTTGASSDLQSKQGGEAVKTAI